MTISLPSRLVVIAMDALDQLLVSCHDYSLNLFVESFLKMVQKLLECDEIELQILATSSVSTALFMPVKITIFCYKIFFLLFISA